MNRKLTLLAATFLGSALLAACGASAETIVVVRHGDRDRSSPDQRLLPEGENRAREIGRLLRHERVDHIFYSRGPDEKPKEWVRMCQTARGIAAGLESAGDAPKSEPLAIPRFDSNDGPSLRQWLLGEDGKDHPHAEASDDADVLVLHHEDIAALVDVLTSPDDPKQGPHVQVGKEDYDNVFVLTRGKGEKKFALVRLTLTPAPATQPSATQPAPGCDAGPADEHP